MSAAVTTDDSAHRGSTCFDEGAGPPLLVIPGSCSGCSHQRLEEAPVSGAYEGRQIVGMDLHRRRSVLVRMTEAGEALETVRISNDPQILREVMARAGESPEVVLEATYGWYVRHEVAHVERTLRLEGRRMP